MNEHIETLANKSIYYWKWYQLTGQVDNLAAAIDFMKDYRKLGGTNYPDEERQMNDAVNSANLR